MPINGQPSDALSISARGMVLSWLQSEDVLAVMAKAGIDTDSVERLLAENAWDTYDCFRMGAALLGHPDILDIVGRRISKQTGLNRAACLRIAQAWRDDFTAAKNRMVN